MKNRLFKSHFTASMLSFVLCLLLVIAVVYRYFIVEYMSDIKEEASYIGAAIEVCGVDFLEEKSGSEIWITVISSDGKVIFNNNSADTEIENHLQLEEVQQAIANGTGESHQYMTGLASRTINYAVQLKDGNILRISKTQFSIVYLLANILLPIMVIVLAAIIFSAFTAVRTAQRLTEPINKIDLEAPDDRDAYDEIKPLIRRITEQNRQIHKQMEQIKEEHKKQENMRREFTANVSHELKTPLTSISGFAEIIRDGLVKQEDIPRFADNIYKEAQRLVSLVEDIIKLSMAEDKEIKAEKAETEMYNICKHVIDMLTPTAKKHGIQFALHGESAYVYGVSSMLEEIVYNLCDNAVKYNKENGRIDVTVENLAEAVLISVADTGIGIPKDELDRVFERFYRVNKSHSKEIGGTGLGLSIVKHGATYNNGTVSIESQFGKGTIITVKFNKQKSNALKSTSK